MELVSHDKSRMWTLALGSVGVVYGDIGTSPLYAFRVAVVAAGETGPVTRETVLGVLSMILWALIVVVAIKYVLLLLRADNNGRGRHVFAHRAGNRALGRRTALVFLLGDRRLDVSRRPVITPAISVLSAVEGLKLVTPAFDHYVVPSPSSSCWRCSRRRAGERRGSLACSVRSWWCGSWRSRSPACCTFATTPACSPPSIRATRWRFFMPTVISGW
jgi:hypothetical protein